MPVLTGRKSLDASSREVGMGCCHEVLKGVGGDQPLAGFLVRPRLVQVRLLLRRFDAAALFVVILQDIEIRSLTPLSQMSDFVQKGEPERIDSIIPKRKCHTRLTVQVKRRTVQVTFAKVSQEDAAHAPARQDLGHARDIFGARCKRRQVSDQWLNMLRLPRCDGLLPGQLLSAAQPGELGVSGRPTCGGATEARWPRLRSPAARTGRGRKTD